MKKTMQKKELIDLLKKAGYVTYKGKDGVTRWQKDGRYTLRHGEYDRPDYQIRKIRGENGYYISVRYYFYNNTMYAPKDGPMSDEHIQYLYMDAAEREREE